MSMLQNKSKTQVSQRQWELKKNLNYRKQLLVVSSKKSLKPSYTYMEMEFLIET